MKYIEQREIAATWLLSTQNTDFGWGLNPQQASSIVNTAEALFVLNQVGRLPTNISSTTQYLINAIKTHPIKRGKNLRYIAFGLIGLINAGLHSTDPEILNCVQILESAQNENGSWGHTYDSSAAKESRLFPTFLAIWSMQMLDLQAPRASINKGLSWLISVQKADGGWGFTDSKNEPSNAVCTAYALMVLHRDRLSDSRVQNGKRWLIEHAKNWNNGQQEGEPVGGTDWYHCSTVWAIHALLDCGITPTSSEICEAVAHFWKLFDGESGGWRQSTKHVVNIRSIYWAVVALERFRKALDLEDVVLLGINSTSDQQLVRLGNRKFCFTLPKNALPVVLISVTSVSAIATTFHFQSASSSVMNYIEVHIDEFTANVIVTLIALAAFVILLSVHRQYETAWLVIFCVVLLTIPIAIWFLTNPVFINLFSIVGTLLSLLPLIFLALRRQEQGNG